MTSPLPDLHHAHGIGAPSQWVKRWSHLVAKNATVLDLACGQGRHMQWFATRGNQLTGVDRSAEALAKASTWGQTITADLENGPWPLMQKGKHLQFGAVIVTNYLWRQLFPDIQASLATDGVLIYETFSAGNETVGKPSRPDFLLQPGELLKSFSGLRIIAYEDGFIADPERFVQRMVAIKMGGPMSTQTRLARYLI